MILRCVMHNDLSLQFVFPLWENKAHAEELLFCFLNEAFIALIKISERMHFNADEQFMKNRTPLG